MTILCATGTFAAPTGAIGTTLAITGLGFQPLAVFFYWSGDTSATQHVGRATYQRGFGAAVSTTSRWACGTTAADASATINAARIHRGDAIVALQLAAGTVDALLDLQSLDAGGFTVIVDDVFPVATQIGYMAFGGTELTNAACGNFQIATVTGNMAVTGVGFKPDAIIVASAGLASAPPSTSSSRANLMYGHAVSSSQRGVWYGGCGAEAAVTSNSVSYCIDTEFFAFGNDAATSIVARADLVSFDTDGLTYNMLATDGFTRYVWYLALKGGNYAAGSLTTQTDTTTPMVVSGLSFAPTGALFASHGMAESTAGTVQNHDRLSIGAASSTTARNAFGTLDEDNLADTEITTAIEVAEAYVNISLTSTVDGTMDMQSFDSGGFTTIMDNADPAGACVLYFTTGPAAVAAAEPVIHHAIYRN